jgi:hypothetical protein
MMDSIVFHSSDFSFEKIAKYGSMNVADGVVVIFNLAAFAMNGRNGAKVAFKNLNLPLHSHL